MENILPLKIKNLKKNIPGFEKPLFEELCLEISEPGLYALTGPSGSGKTTLLNIITGITEFDEGIIKFNEKNIKELRYKELLNFRRDRMGIMFQKSILMDEIDVLDNICLKGIIRQDEKSQNRKKAEELLNLLNLGKIIKSDVKNLSTGETMRIAFLRAIFNEPEILICDEPTGNLDYQNSFKLIEIIKEICEKRKITVLIATHDREILHFFHKVYKIKDRVLVEIKN